MANKNELLEHNYDGIQEYDNPTPGWWHIIFLSTIAFSIPYFVIFEMNPDVPTIQDRVALDEKVAQQTVLAAIGDVGSDEASLISLMRQSKKTGVIGAAIYRANCVSCHGKDGEGVVGPNMTDDYYKNVKQIMDIPSVVTNGAAGGAMPAWKNRLNEKEVLIVSAYMASLRGRNTVGRAPEGVVIPAWGIPASGSTPAQGTPAARAPVVPTSAPTGN